MSQVPGADDGVGNSTTAVTLIGAPIGTDKRTNLTCTIHNRDTAVITVEVRKVSAGGTRRIWRGQINVGNTFILDDAIILDDTSSSITFVMSAAPATTQPDWTSSWFDEVA
jgi:hypothetical protein